MRPIIAKYIKKWFEDGHEIGNHSWSHPVNFGELSQSEIKEEIFKTEQIILKTIRIRNSVASICLTSSNQLIIMNA